MIGTISIKIAAHNPSFPLEPVYTFVNSAQSFRILNVPKKIGKWDITGVFVNVSYPDNTVVAKECVLNGSVWVGTVSGCATSGTSTNGFVVTASGVDEDGNTVSNYVLGAGDLYVQALDGTIAPETSAAKMYFFQTTPTSPKVGDATFIDGTMNIWDGTAWQPVAPTTTPSYIEDADGNKIEADLDCYTVNPLSPWFYTSNQYTYDPTTQKWIWIEPGMGLDKQELTFYSVNNTWSLRFFSKQGDWDEWQQVGSDSARGGANATELNYEMARMTFTRTVLEQDRLAKISDIDNSYIEDADGNRIDADGDVTYLDSNKWSVDLGWYGKYVLSPTGTDEWTYAEPEGHEGNKKIVLHWIDNMWGWELLYYQWNVDMVPGGDWTPVASGSTSDSQQATSLEINLSGDITTTAECRKGATSTDKLALKSELPTKTSDLTNDSGFITSSEIEPYHNGLTPTENTGLAKTAYMLALADSSSFEPVESGKLAATLRTDRDLTNHFRATMAFSTYYPYVMSKYNGQTLSPEVELYFCKDQLRYGTTRPRPYYEGYMFRTGGAGFAIPCSEDGTPEGMLVETTAVQNGYVLMENDTTSIHIIDFSARYDDPYGNINKIDGQSDSIFAYRASPHKMYSFSEEIANKSELPTVNNATITLTQGGTTKGTFSLNQETAQTIALDAPPTNTITLSGTYTDQTAFSYSVYTT